MSTLACKTIFVGVHISLRAINFFNRTTEVSCVYVGGTHALETRDMFSNFEMNIETTNSSLSLFMFSRSCVRARRFSTSLGMGHASGAAAVQIFKFYHSITEFPISSVSDPRRRDICCMEVKYLVLARGCHDPFHIYAGAIPKELGALNMLEQLSLYSNQLRGEFCQNQSIEQHK